MNIIEYLEHLLTYHLFLVKEIQFLIKRLSYFLLEMIHKLLSCLISKIEKLIGVHHIWEDLDMVLTFSLKMIAIKLITVIQIMDTPIALLKS